VDGNENKIGEEQLSTSLKRLTFFYMFKF